MAESAAASELSTRILLIEDDAQWSDPESGLLVGKLRRLADLSIARTMEEAEALLAELGEQAAEQPDGLLPGRIIAIVDGNLDPSRHDCADGVGIIGRLAAMGVVDFIGFSGEPGGIQVDGVEVNNIGKADAFSVAPAVRALLAPQE